LPFSEISQGDRCAPVFLTDTIRSQGFSPSQRFCPTQTLWLYFAPHPLIGFRPSELFPPEPAVMSLDILCSPAIRRPCHLANQMPIRKTRQVLRQAADTGYVERGRPGFRALLQPGVRHLAWRVSAVQSRCSLGLCPLRGLPARLLAKASPHALGRTPDTNKQVAGAENLPVLQGLNPVDLGQNSRGSSANLLEVCHLMLTSTTTTPKGIFLPR
jgi:hypothetical protein